MSLGVACLCSCYCQSIYRLLEQAEWTAGLFIDVELHSSHFRNGKSGCTINLDGSSSVDFVAGNIISNPDVFVDICLCILSGLSDHEDDVENDKADDCCAKPERKEECEYESLHWDGNVRNRLSDAETVEFFVVWSRKCHSESKVIVKTMEAPAFVLDLSELNVSEVGICCLGKCLCIINKGKSV